MIEAALSFCTQQGFNALSSVLAARLGRHVPAVKAVFEGTYGHFPVYHAVGYDRNVVLDGLGARYRFTGTSIKPYPNGRATHPALDAGIALRASFGKPAHRIERVELRGSPIAAKLTAPPERARRFDFPRERRFSQAWSFALGYVRGGARLKDFSQTPPDLEALQRVAERVEVIARDEDASVRGAGRVQARIHAQDGSCAEAQIEVPLGGR